MFGIQIEQIYQKGLTTELIEEKVLELMRNLADNPSAKVKFYSGRTIYGHDTVFDADRESMLPLEYMLAIKAGTRPDNRIVYEVYDGCRTFYVYCGGELFRVSKYCEVES